MRNGVIADYDITEAMLKHFIGKASNRFSTPVVMICIPAGVTTVEMRAVRDWTSQLGRIACPVRVVGGALDPGDAAGNAEVFRRHLPRLEAHLLPGVSHLLQLEAPERFNEILLDFLGRVAGE